MEKIADEIRAFPLPAIGAAFLVGLLLGWLAIGWWLWPVGWTHTDPWDLRTEHQQRYLSLVVKNYAQSRNADQAKESLAGWDKRALSDLLAIMQDQAPDLETSQQLAELASALELPTREAIEAAESGPASSAPSLITRLATVCVSGGGLLVVIGLIALAVYTAPWKSITARARGARRAPAVEEPELLPGHFVSTYVHGRDDYDDYFSIEAPDGRFLGECGLSIARTLGRETPRQVTALEMVLFDSLDHRTETRILMSRYAHEDAALRRELITRGELILAEPGIQALVETKNLQILATVTDLDYADQDPPEGVFLRLAVELQVKIKRLPARVTAEVESSAA